MPSGDSIQFPGGSAHVVSLAELRDTEAWSAAFQALAKDSRFYEIVEETIDCGFEHHSLILEDNHGRVRGIQPFFFVQQNLVEGVPALRAAVDLIRRNVSALSHHARPHGRLRGRRRSPRRLPAGR